MSDVSDVREILERIVNIPSVTGDERGVGEELAALLDDAGLAVETQTVEGDRSNVIARLRGGDGPTLLFAGHMDVVPAGEGWSSDPFHARVEGDLLYGRGSCDMKGGLAAVIAALRSVRRTGVELPGDVLVACLVGEEEDLAGAHAAVHAGLAADMAVVVEPTELQVVIAHKGAVLYSVHVHGHAAHASTPEAGVNAIEGAVEVVQELTRAAARDLPTHPILGAGTLNIGTIHGGTRPYVVPDEVVIEVDRRILPGETLESVCAEAEPLLKTVGARRRGLRIELRPDVEALPLETDRDHPVVLLLAAALQAADLPMDTAVWPAVSDASVIANEGAIPTVLFGPGSLAKAAHQPDEHIALPDVARAAEVYLHAMSLPRDITGDV